MTFQNDLRRDCRPPRMLWAITIAVMLLNPITSAGTPERVSAQAPMVEVTPATVQNEESSPAGDQSEATADPLIFSDDFEAYGDSTRWNRGHPFTVQREVVANGSYAARLTNSGGLPMYGQKSLDQGYERLYIRLRFQVIEIDPRPVTLVQLRAGQSQSLVSIQIQPSGQISYTTAATGITSHSAIAAMPGEWHDLQILVDTSVPEDNLRVWLGNIELTTMQQTAWLGDGTMRIIELGDNSAGQQSDIAVDDVIVDDAFIPPDREADPVSGTLRVRAIPAWSGIDFELDGEIYTTDAEGVARIQVKRWSPDLRSRIVVHDATGNNTSKVSFTGWREWLSPHSRDVFATFELWEPISFNFVDMQGAPVDTTMIDSLIIKSSIGEIYTLHADDLDEPVLLISSVVTTPTGLHNKPITYFVDQVIIDGANVVNRAQQRMTFESTRNWEISLLFYAVKFQAVDAFFGTPLGDEVVVQAADGSEQRLTIDDNGEVVIPRLPRGEYAVSVVGGGYSPPRPIRISRDQAVQLEVISQLDVLLLAGTASAVVVGLMIAGRPFIVTKPLSLIAGALTPLVVRKGRGTTL